MPSTVTKSCRMAALTADGRGTLIEKALRPLDEGMVLIRTTRSMVSAGTHLGCAAEMRASPEEREPTPIGYQCAGTVAAVGPGVEQFQVGQRVAGFGAGAKHAPWNVVPQNLCALIPDEVSDDEASAINLVLTGVQANRRAQPEFGEFFLVVGMGLVGQFSAQIARAAGCYVMGWDALPARLDLAERLSIDATYQVTSDDNIQEVCRRFTRDIGFDAAIMAFGGDGTQALQQVASVMKITRDTHRMGRIVLVGGLTTQAQWGAGLGNLDLRSAARTGPGYHDNEWEIGHYAYPPVFTRWNTQTNMCMALRWIAEKKIQVAPLITHRFTLDQFDEAVDMLVESPQSALGVMIETDET